MGCSLYTDGSGYEAILVPQGGSRTRYDNISINIGLKDGSACVDMDGKAVWEFATNAFPTCIRDVTEKVGISVSDIDVVIPHQANINIIKESMKKLELPFEKAFVNIQKYGNTVGASVFIALAEAVREGRIEEGSKVALAAFGAGLAWGSALIEWNSKEDFCI